MRVKKILKPFALPPLRFYQKYFSEVGYITRFFNYKFCEFLQKDAIAKRIAAAKVLILPNHYESLLSELQANGGAKTSLSTFGVSNDIIDILAKKSAAFGNKTGEEIKNTRKGLSKTYWTDVFDKNDPDYKPLIDFALNPTLIAVIAKYLGQLPTLQHINFYYSPADGQTDKLIGSQGWHLDNEQKTKLKIFLSPFEMTIECGPTTFLPLPFSDKTKYKNYPNYFDDMQARSFGLNIDQKIAMLTKPGEFFMADTSQVFHYGARNQTQPRWLAILTYGPIEHHLRPKGWQKFYDASAKFASENQLIEQKLPINT